jgi:hypothetical protein
LNKAAKLWEDTIAQIIPFPDNDQFRSMDIRQMKEIVDQRRKLSFSDGICYAFAAINTDERKKRNQKEDYSI